jgi:P-type E1-E2 ATPase
MKSGDIILLNGQLRLIPSLLELGAATYRTIVQNLFWAFGYNLVAIPLAMGGILSPSYGALAMALSDLIVVGNSLLLAKRALPSGELS